MMQTDPLIREKLEWFQDMKFGLMIHWGPYSQWGAVESWSLCREDEPWCRRHIEDYDIYKSEYEKLRSTFNPEKFDADKWAAIAKKAGMRYLVFSTKHHDGFCMFDSAHSNYKITDSSCPFHQNPDSNVSKVLFDTFRDNGFGIGVYFSKPDWHHPDYWASEWPAPDRNVNYDTSKYPERWKSFCDFTFNQIKELVSDYGKIDILWLDGAWVRPISTITEKVKEFCKSPHNQDIDMPRIASMARSFQSDLLIVDRWVDGAYEDYQTPEQQVPIDPIFEPWETCQTMGEQWSFNPDDNYKSTRSLIHLLVDVVSKGGNLLLNIGPDPNGELPREAYIRLDEIGNWMEVNSDAIYNTRPILPNKERNIRFTALKHSGVNAIYLTRENELNPPRELILQNVCFREVKSVKMLGCDHELEWSRSGEGIVVNLPDSLIDNPPCKYAWSFCIRGR